MFFQNGVSALTLMAGAGGDGKGRENSFPSHWGKIMRLRYGTSQPFGRGNGSLTAKVTI